MGILLHSTYQNNEEGVILVTGASGFLGNALVEKLLIKKKKLILIAHSQFDALSTRYQKQESVRVIRHHFVSDPTQKLLQQIKNPERVESVFHLACPNTALASLQDLMQVNVATLSEMSEYFLPHFSHRGWGNVYVMGSRYAFYPPQNKELLTYSMVKAAQLTTTRYWAKQSKVPLVKFIYLAPTHFASPSNRMRNLEDSMPVTSFLDKFLEKVAHYENGDVVLFDYRSDSVVESKLIDGMGASFRFEEEIDVETQKTATREENNLSKNAQEKEFIQRLHALFPSTRKVEVSKVWGIQFGSIPEWDSLGHLRLIVEMEGAFQKRIPSQLIPKLSTIQAVFDAL